MAFEQNSKFIPLQGDYENLAVYKIASCVYIITEHFVSVVFPRGSRTIDQMLQAARSAKQNIAEGSVDGATSIEMEIKLMNVARGSMHELKADYEDFLLHSGLQKWDSNDPRTIQTRNFARVNNDAELFRDKMKERSPETVANIALTLIHQYDFLMVRLIESIKQRFLHNGGIREQMYKARLDARNNPGITAEPAGTYGSTAELSEVSEFSESSETCDPPDNSETSEFSEVSETCYLPGNSEPPEFLGDLPL